MCVLPSPPQLRRRVSICNNECCFKRARATTQFCVAHGGGKRCKHVGCTKMAQVGGTPHCINHGGGKRCHHHGCSKSAISGTGSCTSHGGGRRCQHEGCSKGSAKGTSHLCSAHGGGNRCQLEGCTMPAKRANGKCERRCRKTKRG
jgi:hypothetical protein